MTRTNTQTNRDERGKTIVGTRQAFHSHGGAVLFACFFLMLIHATNSLPPSRLVGCGDGAQSYMEWFCRNPDYQHDTDVVRHPHYVLNPRHLLPPKGRDPFKYQAWKCCKYTCTSDEFKWMCKYADKIKKCKAVHGAHLSHAFRQCRHRIPDLLVIPR